MIHWIRCLFSLLCISLAAASLSAEENWEFPNLLPFSAQDAKPAKKASGRNTLGSSLVRPVSFLVPDLTPLPKARPGSNSAWNKLTAGTKQLQRQTTQTLSSGAKKISRDTRVFLAKSQQLLMPWSQPAKTSTRRTSSRSGSSGSRSGGGDVLALPDWWSSEQKPTKKPALTPTDWLGQDRVGD